MSRIAAHEAGHLVCAIRRGSAATLSCTVDGRWFEVTEETPHEGPSDVVRAAVAGVCGERLYELGNLDFAVALLKQHPRLFVATKSASPFERDMMAHLSDDTLIEVCLEVLGILGSDDLLESIVNLLGPKLDAAKPGDVVARFEPPRHVLH